LEGPPVIWQSLPITPDLRMNGLNILVQIWERKRKRFSLEGGQLILIFLTTCLTARWANRRAFPEVRLNVSDDLAKFTDYTRPTFFFCIMDSTVCLIACRTGKLAPLEKVQMNIQTFLVNIKLTLRNLPWGCQHQRDLD